ncbi:helix-turn-helix domain-containing protein [Quadrisphaera sp. DSM 44207]|uniref:helix-turn-helix domain-containing protein n=1 Tax=Quadrisphaera sp. DSM 44207 TaxID=1881057 RepID=UPI0021012AA2|nr:helix-turn-helix domain-containing protein [Quadrisphaera sp. DSM 44207]
MIGRVAVRRRRAHHGLVRIWSRGRQGGVVAEIKKGARITGGERSTLAEDLKAKYAQGASIRALAAETGRSYGFVHRILSESDVSLRSRGGATRGERKAS